ncbi:MAG: ADP-heptose--LPS heptosyltransferase [Candidatus Binataceae bacterium]
MNETTKAIDIGRAGAAGAQRLFRLAVEYLKARRIEKAINAFDAAEKAGYARVECAGSRWTCWMLIGRFEQAWGESDSIAATGGPDPNCLWDGGSFRGKRVMLRCLHGYGDTVQFIRYAPIIRAEASHLIVETHPEMVCVLKEIKMIDELITWGALAPAQPPQWDQQIEIMELPRAFRTTIETVPDQVPYLDVAPNQLEHSRGLLGDGGKPRVGFAWASSRYNMDRSIPLSMLVPMFETESLGWYSLQRGPERDRIAALRDRYDIYDAADHSIDLSGTAADIANMDLVITVDTVIAHLAGALGRPVWLMLPYQADWRWMLGRSDSPWYPSMRLFRQSRPGDWRSVIGTVVRELRQWALS